MRGCEFFVALRCLTFVHAFAMILWYVYRPEMLIRNLQSSRRSTGCFRPISSDLRRPCPTCCRLESAFDELELQIKKT
jgi:hypothetical protein